MSTSIDTVRTERPRASDRDPDRPGRPPVAWRAIDVSDLAPGAVRRYAREADGRVHLERKAGRTFLVAE